MLFFNLKHCVCPICLERMPDNNFYVPVFKYNLDLRQANSRLLVLKQRGKE